MAFYKIHRFRSLAQYLPKSNSAWYHATAATATAPLESTDLYARNFRLYTKSHVASLFARYAPSLDPVAYLAAAQVFPMRANNYVVEDLIDWYVERLFLYIMRSDTASVCGS